MEKDFDSRPSIVMESTGHYNKILFHLLYKFGFKEPCNPVLMDFYKRKSQSKPKKVALGAVMHKLVYIIFAILRDRKPFELPTPEEHTKMFTRKYTAT